MASGEDLGQAVSARAVSKLIDAEVAIGHMVNSRSGDEYRRAFEHCTVAIQTARDRLNGDVKRVVRRRQRRHLRAQADDWVRSIDEYARQDDLLTWIVQARNTDVHEGGVPAISLTLHADYMNLDDYGSEPVPGAELVLSGEQVSWVTDLGTPDERRISAEPLFGTATAAARNRFQVVANRPPRTHRGVILPSADPVSLCRTAVAYWRTVIREAVAR